MAAINRVVLFLAFASLLVAEAARHPAKAHSAGKKTSTGGITVVNAKPSSQAKTQSIVVVGGNNVPKSAPSSSSSSTDYKANAQAALQALSKIPALSKYADLLNTIFSFYDALVEVTVLLPMRPDNLYNAYKNYTQEQQQLVASYHILGMRYNFVDMKNLPNGEELFTLEGSSIVKQGPAGSYLVMMSDNSTTVPAVVVAPNLYNNTNFIVHGISRMLTPPDFSQ